MFGHIYTQGRGRRTNPLQGQSTGKRQKQVFDIEQIPHLWAHRTQQSARNAQGNFYFDGPTIYSYGSHFPIASHVKGKQGDAILFTTDTRSVTTSRHTWVTRRAIPSSVPLFHIPLSSDMLPNSDGKLSTHAAEAIIRAYQDSIREDVSNALEARTAKKIGEWLDSARAERARLERFVKFFGLPAMSERARIASRKLPVIPATVEDAKAQGKAAKQAKAREEQERRERLAREQMGRAKDWMSQHPDYTERWDGTLEHASTLYLEWADAQRKREREEYDARQLAAVTEWMSRHPDQAAQWDGTREHGLDIRWEWEQANRERVRAEQRLAWLNGQGERYPESWGEDTQLRIIGDEVQTSRGARFPVSHAAKGLRLVRAVMARGEEWHTNGHTCRLGHYQIDRITAEGTVYAGCHVVKFTAIQRIAEQLDAYTEQANDNTAA